MLHVLLIKSKTFHQQKDYNLLYSNTCFIVVEPNLQYLLGIPVFSYLEASHYIQLTLKECRLIIQGPAEYQEIGIIESHLRGFLILSFYCCSIRVVCIFSPPLHPTPDSLGCFPPLLQPSPLVLSMCPLQ